MKIKFYPNHRETKTTTLKISIFHKGKRAFVYSGIQILTEHWDSKKQKVKAKLNKAFVINNKLSEIEEYFYNKYNNSDDISVDKIKIDIENFINNKNDNSDDDLFSHFETYIKNLIDNNKLKISSAKQKMVTITFLKEFNPELKFNDINLNMLEDFTIFLIEKEFTNVYIKKQIKMFKSFLNNYAVPNKLVTDLEYKTYSIKELPNNSTAFIALNEKEIDTLKELELDERLTKIRDLFLFQCYTGLRVSDLMKLKKENIDIPNGMIEVNTLKTSKNVKIPLIPYTKQILNKYDYSLPILSDVKYNKNIKVICKLAGLDEEISSVKYIGKKRVDYIKKKYEMVTSHSARRTFITILLNKGMLPEKVMKLSGHLSRADFDGYVRITQSDAIDEMKNMF